MDPNQGPTKLEYRYNASCLDKLTYGWIFPLLWYGRSESISQDVLEDLSVEEQSQSIYYKWNDYWNEQKANNPKDPLMASIKDTFRRNHLVTQAPISSERSSTSWPTSSPSSLLSSSTSPLTSWVKTLAMQVGRSFTY